LKVGGYFRHLGWHSDGELLAIR